MRTNPRSELVAFKVTPDEKLAIVKRARRHPYKGNISALLRDLLTSSGNDKSASTYQGEGALVTSNH